jgi:hypothetical protein
MTARRGSCLCNRVRYQIDGDFLYVGNYHCSNCRKSHGAAFATFGAIAKDSLHFLSGDGAVARYQSSPDVVRAFCQHCGANLFSEVRSRPDTLHFRLGTLDDDPGVRPAFHAFVSSKAPWFEITDDLPQFPRLPRTP